MKIITTVLTAFILLAPTQVASPQDGRFELAGVFATTFQEELDAADLGIGVRAGTRCRKTLWRTLKYSEGRVRERSELAGLSNRGPSLSRLRSFSPRRLRRAQP